MVWVVLFCARSHPPGTDSAVSLAGGARRLGRVRSLCDPLSLSLSLCPDDPGSGLVNLAYDMRADKTPCCCCCLAICCVTVSKQHSRCC